MTDRAKLDAFLASWPYARFLGMEARLEGKALTAVLPFSAHLVGNPLIPALHGGVVGGFLELAALAELAASAPDGHAPRTVDITIDYLRPARDSTTYARAEVIKRGRRVANVQVTAWQGNRATPVATLRGHFVVNGPPLSAHPSEGRDPGKTRNVQHQGR
jgi:uncharacterized protein (TIGR00369 family)